MRAARLRRALELAEQPALADARLAGHEDGADRTLGRALQRAQQRVELGSAPDQLRAGDALGHPPII
jgi:hypothetical protein